MRLSYQRKLLRSFRENESGVATTDFVVITAAIVGLGLAVGSAVGFGGLDLAEDTASVVEAQASDTSEGSPASSKTKAEKRAERKAKRKEERERRRAEKKAKKEAKKKK